MGDVNFDLLNNIIYEENSKFSESSLGFESFSNDIKSFTLFLQFIDKNKYKLKTFLDVNFINDNELREFSEQGEIYIGGNKRVKEKYDNSNFQQLAKKLLDKFESMKVWEIFNEIHLDNKSNIRGDIIKFVNILESKLDTNNKFKFERQHQIRNTKCSDTNGMGDLLSKEESLSNIVEKNKNEGNESIKEENKTEKNELHNCLQKSNILDLNILKSDKVEQVTENCNITLSSKVTASNNVENATKKDVKHIATNTDQCAGVSKVSVQNQYHNVGKNYFSRSKNGISLAQVHASTLDEKIKHVVKETIDAKFSSMAGKINFNMFENDRVGYVPENTEKTSVYVDNKSCPADCKSKAENQHKNKLQTDIPQSCCCYCPVHGSLNRLHIQKCSKKTEQKSVGMEKNTNTKQINKYNPSTITVQNVSDMLFSLSSTLSNAPVCIKNQRIIDLNPPKSMGEAIYVLSYITKYMDDSKHIKSSNYVNEEVIKEDVTKVIYEKTHLLLQNLMTMLASSFNQAK